jgi:hypothetical protein
MFGRLLKTLFAGCSKELRGEAREKSTSGGVWQYVEARRLKRNEALDLFQQPAGGFNEAREMMMEDQKNDAE